MVLKYKRPDGTGGVICRPISREELSGKLGDGVRKAA